MQELLFNVLYCVLYGLVVWAAGVVVKIVVPYIKAKLESSQYEWAAEIIDHAVRAYEQTVVGDKRGEERFELVLMYATRELERLGIKLSKEQITMLIEAAVQVMKAESVDPIFVGELDAPIGDFGGVINCSNGECPL